jgi:crotonobetainyl-CoA:carnitine CoA-transferase CaiB-like acyl-CoA transferase
VAIAVATDQHWAALREALGNPPWAADEAYRTAVGRRRAHDSIDSALAAWCRRRPADEIVSRLWDAGVPVAKVMPPHRQPDLAQLAARGFFEELDHPVAPRARYATLPMRFSRGPQRLHRRHAPLLGEHTVELLGQAGLSADAIADLDAKGVVGMAMKPVESRPQATSGAR